MLNKIKLYAGAALVGLIGILTAIANYRGKKIDELEKKQDDLIEKTKNAEKEIKIREKVQEIMSEPDDVNLAAQRLRDRNRSRNRE
jgi:Tfp pilus assembly protein PilN